MTDSQKKNILDKYLNGPADESMLELSVQELIFLYASVIAKQKEDASNEEWAQKRQYVFSSVLLRLMRSEELYVAYHVMTGYPYIDVRGCAWVFTEKEFSKAAHEHYFKEGVPLTMKTFTGNEAILDEMFELYRIGVKQFIVDNGQPNVTVSLKDILSVSTESEAPSEMNPELMFTVLTSLEVSYASDGKHPALAEADKKIKELIETSHFLVPVQTDRHLADGEVMKITGETPSKIAVVNPLKLEKGFVAAFTDWREFTKLYSKDEWNAVIMDHAALKDAASNADGFIINPSGFMYIVKNEA
ncbi:SseB family protein [Ruminococcus sp. HUN007]|uniref:SseB family protein n=1 Tax=Ruminococcus sp. HUN007 TaxID=1514668 RepID=UPI0005D2CE4B|nr:SseB family protein [Ruminococcus sp. HUN007]